MRKVKRAFANASLLLRQWQAGFGESSWNLGIL
jgi:hypothetical protein